MAPKVLPGVGSGPAVAAAPARVGPDPVLAGCSPASPAGLPPDSRPPSRIARRTPGGAPGLRTVEVRRAPKVAPELWVAAHFADLPTVGRTLEQLAARAQRFTPRVSLVPPDGLLLEVKGSLHLFNGMEGLLAAVKSECVDVGARPSLALAPTPFAASVAARSGRAFLVDNPAQLISQLAPLPLAPLRWPEDVVQRLARMGVRTVGQLLRLPRAGFARRFGVQQLAELDRLSGRNPDLRRSFEPRERFRRRRELGYELESAERILAALQPLLADLGRFLLVRQCGVMEVQCLLRHRHAPTSECVVRLAAPLADVGRLTELLGDRLNALVLPEPVRSCEIRSGALVGRVMDSKSLWRSGEYGSGASAESPELIERLRSKLGAEAVYGLQVNTAHRPESAWSACEPAVKEGRAARVPGGPSSGAASARAPVALPTGVASARASKGPSAGAASARAASHANPTPWAPFTRPLWLLREPQLLQERDGLPRRRGALRLLGDVERIETGWWDGGDIQRNYYKAVDIHGVHLWIFRECSAPNRWFLHGVFG